jgi:hypothetical protein
MTGFEANVLAKHIDKTTGETSQVWSNNGIVVWTVIGRNSPSAVRFFLHTPEAVESYIAGFLAGARRVEVNAS